MDHVPEFKEELEIEEEESPEVHKSVLTDPSPPTRDISIRGRGKVRETWGPISASLGAMGALIVKLDMLLLAPPQGCSSKMVRNVMHLLKDDVGKISFYLDELSEVEDPPPTAKCWMNEARDLSYKMEDYVDSLLFMQPADPSLVADDIKNTRSLRKWFSHVKTLKGHGQIEGTISKFRKYVLEEIQRREVYVLSDPNIERTLRRRCVSFGPMLPRPHEETADIVIDVRMNEFISSFSKDGDKHLKVVSILGSACLGKTTLARVLYDFCCKQYICRAFIRVSKNPDTKRIFHHMLSQLQQEDPPQDCTDIDLIHIIKKYLENKRYFIIIDDVWTASVWNIINHAFPKGLQGSRIVTTTQIEDVALTCCCYQSEHVFEVKPLDDDHSTKLFFNRLFGSETYCPEHFKEILNKIVIICGGLPLATVSIASLLASLQPVISVDLLTYIHQWLTSCFSANSTSERTRHALTLSFNYLPHYLKTCLMYLSMYPKGYTFWKDNLMKQWMAEGFIDTTERQYMEEVAQSYVDELIGRRFIQPISINYNNEVLSYAVHDTVHDLIAQKSAEENFVVTIDCNQHNVVSRKARRLSLLFGDARNATTPSYIRKSQVRSLRFVGLFECMPNITEFKVLRVLNLHLSCHSRDEGPVDLAGISELFQLRYLKIACDGCIKLPDHGLKCLETLDIMDVEVVNTVSREFQLPHLLHLSLPLETRLMYEIGRTRSNYLQDLHLTPSVYNLEGSMEVLAYFISRHGNLRTIVVAPCSLVNNIDEHSASGVFISWDDLPPPPLLQTFECSPRSGIIFYNIPKWVGKLGNLCILKIAVSKLMINCVDILRELPALTALSLYVWTMPNEGLVFDKAGFSVLKYFKLRYMSGIASLKFEKDAMPNLWKLKLVFKAIPCTDEHLLHSLNKQHQHGTPAINIKHMPGLREISVNFGLAASFSEYASRTILRNHPGNPTIKLQSVVYSSYGHESTEQKQTAKDILEDEPDDQYDETLERTAEERRSPESSCLHVFTLGELKSATSNFSTANLLHGSFMENNLVNNGSGLVYHGSFDDHLRPGLMRQQVIIKLLRSRECLADKASLRMMIHPHLVKLVGFCNQHRNRMLVYEYMPLGSLQDLLHENFIASLQWLPRLKIAIGAAKGLAFLHETRSWINGGFKASNILLDCDYTAKLWGFGLVNESSESYARTMASQVYNFGVVLLELLAGRPSVDEKQGDGKHDLVAWSRPYLGREDKLCLIMDPGMKVPYSTRAAGHTAMTALWCLQGHPSMRQVVNALEPLLKLVDDKGMALASGIDKQLKTTELTHKELKLPPNRYFLRPEILHPESR